MADGFSIPRTDIAGTVEDLITSYRKAQALKKAQDLELARRNALQGLMSGGDAQEGVRTLMGIGDVEGASMLAKAASHIRGPQDKLPSGFSRGEGGSLVPTTGGPADPDYLARVAAAKSGKVAGAGGVSPAQLNLDKKYAPDLLSWEQGGKGEVEAGLATLDHAIDNLEHKQGISGPAVDMFLRSENPFMRYVASSRYNDAIDTADAHKRAVIGSLKPILGSRPAQALIQSVIEATYNTRLDQPTNLRRLKILKKNLETGRDAKNAMDTFFRQNGTLQGYTGPIPDQIDFNKGLDIVPETPPATTEPELSGFVTGGGQAAPTAASAPAPPDTGIPMPAGMQGVSTPPPGATAAPVADPRQMDADQILKLARGLAGQGMNKDQITKWFAAHGVELPP